MATILKGATVVEALDERLAAEVEELKARGIEPTLAILRVGERGDDISYERGATRRAEKVGVAVRQITLPETSATEELLAAIAKLNADASVHGVLMFRPLPKHIDEELVRNALVPQKDIDGITDLSLAGVFADTGKGFAPCTPSACMEILDYFDIELRGKKAVVIGRSLVVGKPVAMMLLARHATVSIAHSRTENLPAVVREADVVVACVGRAKMVGAEHLRPGQIVIDVGINVAADGTLAGDVDTDAARDIVAAITPVPGGVGTVTTSVLIKHVVEAAQKATR
ncbi:MAG: bifunctional 5,10-methylenetetrahydrofolate dehydrogenase/5,10-methenyltetrahydrofolate cyclohydrolase [Coriobacteriales bacterium]|jgi:methylenetetrahydrofolate dehydrogenase (NADP+)/methenyltetrahydrofolate cyclohydrolase|nr:bifunctional 5,10-methylenetetrahydrofolate dehydrogenase/5,10-methenyltetrahydrofolate cyclohydrolase [Coriobacteriales bacterium]